MQRNSLSIANGPTAYNVFEGDQRTWSFKFKNCKYNGKKVTANNFGQNNQVFFLYNVGNDRSIKDAFAEGLNVVFE